MSLLKYLLRAQDLLSSALAARLQCWLENFLASSSVLSSPSLFDAPAANRRRIHTAAPTTGWSLHRPHLHQLLEHPVQGQDTLLFFSLEGYKLYTRKLRRLPDCPDVSHIGLVAGT